MERKDELYMEMLRVSHHQAMLARTIIELQRMQVTRKQLKRVTRDHKKGRKYLKKLEREYNSYT
jgi:hypothetical protein